MKKILWLLVLLMWGAGTSAFAVTQEEVREGTKLYPSANAKLYRARVLLENKENWALAYEILRDVLKNEKDINATARDKIKRAQKIIWWHQPTDLGHQLMNQRRLSRPFFEAQLWINEALMDSRIEINSSSDSEILLVDQLLLSYFFPGFEDHAEIVYPEANTYLWEKYGATPENIRAARTHASSQEMKKTTPTRPPIRTYPRGPMDPRQPIPSDEVPSGQGSEPVPPSSSPMFAEPAVRPRISPFVDTISNWDAVIQIFGNALDAYGAARELSKKPRVRRNEYADRALLVQALAEPGSVAMDPQLQDLLRNVQLKWKLSEFDHIDPYEIQALQTVWGDSVVKLPDGNYSIHLDQLAQEQRPGTKSDLNLLLELPGEKSRGALWVISTLGSDDLMRFRLLQGAAYFLTHAKAIGGSRFVQMERLLTQLPIFLERIALQWAAAGVSPAPKLMLFRRAVSKIPRLAAKLIQVAKKPKVEAAIRKTLEWEPIKSGKLLQWMVALTITSEVITGGIEIAHADTPLEKWEGAQDTVARVLGAGTYLIPYVGWAAALNDGLHAAGVSPFETSDVYRGIQWWMEEGFLRARGSSHADATMRIWENDLWLPRKPDLFYARARYLTSEEDCDRALVALQGQMQDTALAYLMVMYRAHRTFAKQSNYAYGERIERYLVDLKGSTIAFDRTRAEILRANAEFKARYTAEN